MTTSHVAILPGVFVSDQPTSQLAEQIHATTAQIDQLCHTAYTRWADNRGDVWDALCWSAQRFTDPDMQRLAGQAADLVLTVRWIAEVFADNFRARAQAERNALG